MATTSTTPTITQELWTTVQTRLKKLGYYQGFLDGIPGTMTAHALSDFKKNHGYVERPYPGPLTLGSLFSASAKPKPIPTPPKGFEGEPMWLTEARRLVGVKETPGVANNPVIMQWAKDLDQWYPGDDTAWCGLFLAHCMAVGAPQEPQDFNRLGAREWLKYGVEAPAGALGSICVLWRTHPTTSWNGHVFLVTGQSSTALRGIGGNQSDMVSEAWFSKSRVLGYRMPRGAELKASPTAKEGTLSTNEA